MILAGQWHTLATHELSVMASLVRRHLSPPIELLIIAGLHVLARPEQLCTRSHRLLEVLSHRALSLFLALSVVELAGIVLGYAGGGTHLGSTIVVDILLIIAEAERPIAMSFLSVHAEHIPSHLLLYVGR